MAHDAVTYEPGGGNGGGGGSFGSAKSGSDSSGSSGSGNSCCDPDYITVTWDWIDPRTNQTVTRNDYVPGGCGHYFAEGPPIDIYLGGTSGGYGTGYYGYGYGYGNEAVWFIDLAYYSDRGWEMFIGSNYFARFGTWSGGNDPCKPGGAYLFVEGYRNSNTIGVGGGL